MHTIGAGYLIIEDIVYLLIASKCFFKLSAQKENTFFRYYLAVAFLGFIINVLFNNSIDIVLLAGILILSFFFDKNNVTNNLAIMLISLAIDLLSTLIGSGILTIIPIKYDGKSLYLMCILWGIQIICSFLAFKLINKIIERFRPILNNWLVVIVALYAYISGFYINFISDRYFPHIAPLIITFLIIQCIFVIILFNFELSRHDKLNEQKIKQTEIEGLLKYTEKLEKEERKLRKFKHDYQNMLLSLKELADFEDRNEFKQGVMNLEEYFNVRFASNEIWGFNDFDNLKNPYLKSIFISKVQDMREQKIIAEFSCPQIIENINIPIFDFVRVIGITLDNSIEAVCGHEDGRILMNISKNDDATKFVISNTMFATQKPIQQLISEGYTSKDNHSGLGLKNINEIQTNNNNLFVSYKYEKNLFVATIIVQE